MITRSTLLLAGFLGAAPAAAQTSATIYSDGRVLMRSTTPVRLPAGVSTHRLALGLLDPGSIFSLDPQVTVTGASYDAAVDEINTMRRAVGRRLVFETGRTNGQPDTVSAEVLGVDPERFRLTDGSVAFMRPGRPRYPADLVQIAPTLQLAVRSAAARPALALGWFTGGASWQASYQVVLGRDARVSGQATIPSHTLSLDDAELQLLAGDVGRAGPSPLVRARVAQEMVLAATMDAASQQEVGEAHLYTLPGRHTLRPGVAATVALFEPGTTSWERVFTVRGQLPWYGPLVQTGDEAQVPVEVQYLVQRPARTEFGDRPLPGGTWRIYQPDQQGRLQLVGESAVGHTAPGRNLRLGAGTAFDVTAERVQTDYVTTREARRTMALASYRVTVRNAKDSAITVDVLEERRGEWTLVESSVPAERLSSTQTRFRVRVPAGGEAVLTYRVRVIW